MKIKFAFVLFALLSLVNTSYAVPVTFNLNQLTVNGTDVFSGPSLTVTGNYSLSDTLDFTAVGEVGLASQLFFANAAGIITHPSTTNTGNHPGECAPSNGYCYGALLVGNGSLGFFQLFPANVADGLGNANPPTSLQISRTIGSIFGGATLTNGTILEFLVNDINTSDNSGGFRLSTEVPEPMSLTLLGLGLTGLLRRSRRRAQ